MISKKSLKYIYIAFFILVIILSTIIPIVFYSTNNSKTSSLQSLHKNAQKSIQVPKIPQDLVCNVKVPYEKTQYTPRNDYAIFVSVASYRDFECSDTIKSIYSNA